MRHLIIKGIYIWANFLIDVIKGVTDMCVWMSRFVAEAALKSSLWVASK